MAVTAYAAKGDEERIRDAGAEGYVSKPISVLKFVEAVRALLERRGAGAEGGGGSESPETDEAAAPGVVPGEGRGPGVAARKAKRRSGSGEDPATPEGGVEAGMTMDPQGEAP